MHRVKNKISYAVHHRKHKQFKATSKTGHHIATICASNIPRKNALKSPTNPTACLIQNFLVVWLECNNNESNENNYSSKITILRQIVNSVNVFTSVEQCTEFIRKIEAEAVFVILSGACCQKTVPIIHDMPQINSIYIFCKNKLDHEQWIHKWGKVRDTLNDIELLSEALKRATQELDRNIIPISYFAVDTKPCNESFDESQSLFMFVEFVKKIVSSLKNKQEDVDRFVTYLRQKAACNIAELKNADKLQREYRDYTPAWWYTYNCFLNSMLNHALCCQDIVGIVRVSFFIHDLQQYITQLHAEQNIIRRSLSSFSVYRGQSMTQAKFDQLMKHQKQLLSFNNFLSTSKNQQNAMRFARRACLTSDLIGVLFVITIDPTIQGAPFADIQNVRSPSHTDEDIVFALNTVFRIDGVEQINNNNERLWQAELTLVSHDALPDEILMENTSDIMHPHGMGWYRLSEMLIGNGHINKAQRLCDLIISETSDEGEKGFLYYQLGLIKCLQENYEESSSCYKQACKILENFLPNDHIDTAACNYRLGLVHEKLGEYSAAIKCLEKSLATYGKNLSTDDSNSIDSIKAIARIYFQMEEYSKAIFHYEKIIEIYKTTSDDRSLISIYEKVCEGYDKMGEYSIAISTMEKILHIHKKYKGNSHSDLATIHYCIGLLYEKLREYSIALVYYEKAVEIHEENSSLNHLELATCYKNIGSIYLQRGDFSTALSYLEKAHEIFRKNDSTNSSSLAESYICHGAVYEKMNKLADALLYYQKAFEIYTHAESRNYLGLATTHDKIGLIYSLMGEYATAILHYQSALDLFQKHFPNHQTNIACCYAQIGDLTGKMQQHHKALTFYREAYNIGLGCSLDESCLKKWENSIEMLEKTSPKPYKQKRATI